MMRVDKKSIFIGGTSPACHYAADYLRALGLPVEDTFGENIRYLILDVPSFGPAGHLRGGGDVDQLLSPLTEDIMICGGNLSNPKLEEYETVDFLKDESYLCENAYITAECALDVALPCLQRTLRACPVLIIGWGRIGKCLGQLLKNMGADVTIAARNPDHRAMIHALGYHTADISDLPDCLSRFRLLYNTVPHPVLNHAQMSLCRADCVKIELASRAGIAGDDIITARGLPGIHFPESSGKLIGETFLRLCYGR
jgi:dipicolinate synthase subunit A